MPPGVAVQRAVEPGSRLTASGGTAVVYDGRLASATYGCLNEFLVSERYPGLLVIPEPDALDLPREVAKATDIGPFRW